MTRLIVIDPAGTARQVTRFFVVDSGGVSRRVSRAFVIDSGGSARLIFAGAVITLNDQTVSGFAVGGGNAAAFQLTNDGRVHADIGDGSGFQDTGVWLVPGSISGNYEVRATFVSGFTSGSTITGTFNTYLPLSTSRSWGLSSFGGFAGNYTMTLSLREIATGTVVDTATINISTSFV